MHAIEGALRGQPQIFVKPGAADAPTTRLLMRQGCPNSGRLLGRAMGIEPTSEDWETRNPNKIHRTRLRLVQAYHGG